MKVMFFKTLFAAALVVLAACGEGSDADAKMDKNQVQRDSLTAEIKKMEAVTFANEARFDPNLAMQLMRTYQEFYNANKDNPKSAEYLLKAGELALSVDKSGHALELLKTLETSFPKYEKLPEVANMIAFIYDEKVQDKKKAQKAYEYLIETFPNHKLAKDATARLETLHMTDEELLKHFQELNKN